MSILVPGRITGLVVMAIIVVLGIWALERAKRGKVRAVRELAGMAGLRIAAGRCAEMGRPFFHTTGHGGGGLYTARGPQHMAGIAILGYIARLCAKLGVKAVSLTAFPELIPVTEDTIRMAYLGEGKADQVKPDMVRFLSSYALAFKQGYIGQLTREKAGAASLCGAIWPSDALHMSEPGVIIGAMQIGGAIDTDTLSMLALTCDYVFLGEELYAAGAFASENPTQLSVMFASDIVKIGLVLLMIFGFILSSAGVKIAQLFTI